MRYKVKYKTGFFMVVDTVRYSLTGEKIEDNAERIICKIRNSDEAEKIVERLNEGANKL